jgi:hypothetical protein
LQTFKGDNFSVDLGNQIKGIESLIVEFNALIEEYENSKLKTPLLKKLKEKKEELGLKVTDLKNWETIPLEQSNVLKLDLDALNENDLDDKMDEIKKLKKTEGINATIVAVLGGIKDKIEKKKEEINKKKQEEKNDITQELNKIIEQKSNIMNSYDTVEATNKDTLTLKYKEIFDLLKQEEEVIAEINKIDTADETNLRENEEKERELREKIETIKTKRNDLAGDLNIELDSQVRNVFNDVKKQKEDIEELKTRIYNLEIEEEYTDLKEMKKMNELSLKDYEEELDNVISIMGYEEEENFQANEKPDEYEIKINAIEDLETISTNLKDILKLKLKNLQYQSKLKQIGESEKVEEAKAENIKNALIALEAKEEEERQRIEEEEIQRIEEERQRIEEEERQRIEEERQRIEEEKEKQRIEEKRLAEIERILLVEIALKKKEERQHKLEEVTKKIEALNDEMNFNKRRNETHHEKINEMNDRLLNRLFKVSLKMSDQTYLGDDRDEKIKELYMKNHGVYAEKETMKQWYSKAVQERNEIFG